MQDHPILIKEELLCNRHKQPICLPEISEHSFVRDSFEKQTGISYEEKLRETKENRKQFYAELKQLKFKDI